MARANASTDRYIVLAKHGQASAGLLHHSDLDEAHLGQEVRYFGAKTSNFSTKNIDVFG